MHIKGIKKKICRSLLNETVFLYTLLAWRYANHWSVETVERITLINESHTLMLPLFSWFYSSADKGRMLPTTDKKTRSNLPVFANEESHRLYMELDLQSLFGLHVHKVLIGRDPATPPHIPPAYGLIYEGAMGQPR
jgi:hypothetical protein